MPIHNSDVAEIFNRVADLLDIEGANQFRIRAYRNGARAVEGLSGSVADMVAADEDLSRYSGIGKDLAGKIREIVRTGSLKQLGELEERIPPGLLDLLEVSGLGPKKVKTLYRELDITSLDDLRKAAEKGKVRKLHGFGKKTEQKILDSLGKVEKRGGRMLLAKAEQYAVSLEEYLKKIKGVKDLVIAGSYRRRKETVGDLDILATAEKGSRIMDAFVEYEDVSEVVSKGTTRSTVILRSGLQVDLRVVPEVSYGAALHYFTGSKPHNIAVRKLGQKRGLKVNEYGVFKGDDRVAGKTEEEVYAQVDLPYFEPELRENRGEIEAAGQDGLPDLVDLDDLRGDLHVHTTYTDGKNTLEEMAEAAGKRGYEYLAVTDHTKRVTMAKGLDEKRLAEQIKEIDRLNDKLKGITLLAGAEVDILEDGSLDLDDSVLKDLDLTVCAVHYNLNLSRDKQTERIIRAMDNPYFTILAHPTDRLIGKRDPLDLDMQRIMQAALDRGCILEINAQPDRLDLNDIHAKQAGEMGLKMSISTDAHRIGELDLIRYGVGQARRGWLEPGDVINTRKLSGLKKLLRR